MRAGSKTVLVVEDDPDCLDAVADALEASGYGVERAVHGREALDVLRSDGHVDLILLDLMMPVMDGLEFLARQRSDPTLASIPVVLLSGEATLARRAAVLGVAGHLRKPVDLEALLATLDRLVPRS
ncbi:MAG: response regulator [Deltaproteobacteria bacterium]|nr:response regulator [Deltaproteobacteria bacterium]